MTPFEPAIRTRRLAVSLNGRWVVKDADLSFQRGELAVIVGPNGAGKTTVLRALAGLQPIWGEIQVGGVSAGSLDPRTRARAVAYLPQGPVFHWPMLVADIVALGRIPHGSGLGGLSDADRMAVSDAMADTETTDLAERSVDSLSGGERARVALARLLAVGAPVILADEPTASLDPRYQLRILETLRHQADDGVAVIVVLQDLTLAARFADRILVMDNGAFAVDGPPEEVLNRDVLARIFGVSSTTVRGGGASVEMPWSTIGRRAPRGGPTGDQM